MQNKGLMFYILGKERRLLVFLGEKVNRDELEIKSFFMDTNHYASGAC